MRRVCKCCVSFICVICMMTVCACGYFGTTKQLTAKELQEKWDIDPSVKKVIVDADVHFLGDDVYALNTLVMADKLGYLDLCGVTACCGNTYVEGATYDALAYLEYIGRQDIPVYMGSNDLLSGISSADELRRMCGNLTYVGFYDCKEAYTDNYLEATDTGLSEWDKSEPTCKPMQQAAADYIIEEIHNNPGEVTIVALGALTNVAMALQKDPSIAEDAAGIIYMGGVFDVYAEEQQKLEFNFWCDPEATMLALGAGWKNQVIVSHDAATTCLKGFDLYKMALEHNHNPFSELFIEECKSGCSNEEEIRKKIEGGLLYCWDPITAAYILSPKICTDIEPRYVYVETNKGPTYGLTLNWKEGLQPEGTYKADVVLAVDRDKFWEFFFDISDALS